MMDLVRFLIVLMFGIIGRKLTLIEDIKELFVSVRLDTVRLG